MKDGGTTASYTYSPDGLRVSKTVNGETTTHVLDGANVVADVTAEGIAKYNRGRELISMEQNGQKGYYVFNGHGDVVQMRNASGEQVYQNVYDAFGMEIFDYDETNQFVNPFGYAGEYTDEETGNIYLRARYYDPNTGRFLSEDPIKDGTNWYAYAGNNPVLYIDPTGLFDYNTRLSYSQEYNEDVVALQQQLWARGYLGALQSDEWGYFGTKTLNAVNRYKEDHGLGNSGQDYGVVGLETWKSFGNTIYRTLSDILNGVKIATINRVQFFDVTEPVNNAFYTAGLEASAYNHKGNFLWFKSMVDHKRDWDVKRQAGWTKTIGTSYPGAHNAVVILFGEYTTPEEIGNMLYGYTGTAAGFSSEILFAGGGYAAQGLTAFVSGPPYYGDSPEDHMAIIEGISWYHNRNK